MPDFIGRRHDLSRLREQLRQVQGSGDGSFVWVTGRRRVGKSRLMEEFLRRARVPHLYYRAPRREPAVALQRFAAAGADSSLASAELFSAGVSPDSWVAALRLAAEGATAAKPAVIVLDELPYLVEEDRGFDADLQEAWDRYLQHLPVLLIAIGSDVSMMSALTDYGHALHGRPTRELVVAPFSPGEVAQLLGVDPAAAIDAYLVVGGFPALATTWRKSWDRRRFLEHALADSYSQFVVTGERILEGELGDQPQARRVLEAIGAGERTFSAIRDASGVTNAASLSNVLKRLTETKQIVAESRPLAAPAPKKSTRYAIADPYLRFWLRFVGPGIEELDRGRGDLVIARIERSWGAYRGRAVKPLVREAIERVLPDERFGAARYVGSYWTRSNDVEVDLVGADSPDPSAIAFVGSVKWRERSPFADRDARELARARASVPGAEDASLVGVSRSGFSKGVRLDAAVTPAELIAGWR